MATTQPLIPAGSCDASKLACSPEYKKFTLFQYNYKMYHSVMDRSQNARTIAKVALYVPAALALVGDIVANVVKGVLNAGIHVANYVSKSLSSRKVEVAPPVVVKATVTVETETVAPVVEETTAVAETVTVAPAVEVTQVSSPVEAVVATTVTDEGRDGPFIETVAAANKAVDEIVKDVPNPVKAKCTLWTKANLVKVVYGAAIAAVVYSIRLYKSADNVLATTLFDLKKLGGVPAGIANWTTDAVKNGLAYSASFLPGKTVTPPQN